MSVIYIPTNINIDDFLEAITEALQRIYLDVEYIVLTGDMNINILNIQTCSVQ